MRLDAAVTNMTHGLCMFDRDERLVIANAGYAALYRLPPDLLKPGTLHSDIVEYRTANGMRPVKGVESFMAQHWRLRRGRDARAPSWSS